ALEGPASPRRRGAAAVLFERLGGVSLLYGTGARRPGVDRVSNPGGRRARPRRGVRSGATPFQRERVVRPDRGGGHYQRVESSVDRRPADPGHISARQGRELMDGDDLIERIRRLERAARPLDPGTSRRKQLRNAVVASSERFLRKIRTLKGYVETDDKGIGLLQSPISEDGIPIEAAIELWEHNVIRPGANTNSGAHLAFIPGGGVYHAALGDYLAAVSNKYAGVFFSSPGAVRMENLLVRWVADLVGYPAGAGGNIASGGSIATLTAIVTARDAHGLRAADVATSVVYLTTQAHHSIQKALRIAGLGEAQLRYIPMDDRFRMRPEALEQAIAADRAERLKPWLIVAAAGTTDTGAVDPLPAIADI